MAEGVKNGTGVAAKEPGEGICCTCGVIAVDVPAPEVEVGGESVSPLPVLNSGAPSRKACEVFSRALVLPTSLQTLLLLFFRNRPPRCRTR